jgi:charged multivesicular body protein 5
VKRRALGILKRKRAYEQQRDQLAQQGFNLDQTSYVNSSLQDTATTLAAMKAAQGSMKKQISEVNVDEVYNMTDDMQELMDQHYEIQEAMSRNRFVFVFFCFVLFFFLCVVRNVRYAGRL